VEAGLPPLSQCGKADMYAQIDNAVYFPQIELLEELVHGHPNATFFLTFRSMEKWYHSITHWPPRKNGPFMNDRMKKYNITGSPSNETPSNIDEFSDWYCNHVTRVRNIVARNPSHTLVEVDIEDPGIGQRMEDIFGIDKSCWGRANMNAAIHPEVDPSNVISSKAFIQRDDADADESYPESTDEDVKHNSEDDDDSDDDENDSKDDDYDDYENDSRDDEYDANENDSKDDIGKAVSDRNLFNRTCFRARNETVPSSLYHNLPKPFINLGFPKMGTSSLYSFFKCGGLTSTHFRCGKRSPKCSVCMKESVEAGLPPLSQCGKADMYAQIDNAVYFPQIELLEELVHGHPNATFFLTFRSMEKWYHSITHWPPRKNGPFMNDRMKKYNITGSPSNETPSNIDEFSDWYCNHVTRVRNIVARNPSHTLVEVDIEDPGIGQRMGDIFGIDKSCWGHANMNAAIHPEVNQSEVGLSKQFGQKDASVKEDEARRRRERKNKRRHRQA